MILDSISPQVLKQLPQPDSISSITIAGASAGLIQVDHLFVFFAELMLSFEEIIWILGKIGNKKCPQLLFWLL